MTDLRDERDPQPLAIVPVTQEEWDELEGAEDPGEDLDVVIEYLQGRLDPVRVALVKERLQADPDFQYMAAPLIWAWRVRHAEPEQEQEVAYVSREELEMRWDEFTKRAGFIHQKKKARARHLKLLGVVLLVLVTGAWFAREEIGARYTDWRHFKPVEPVGQWVTVGREAEARVAPGGVLRVNRVAADSGWDLTKLVSGSADFRLTRQRTNLLKSEIRGLSVATPAGVVAATRATFTVRTLGDTTWVDTHKPDIPEYLSGMYFHTSVYVGNLRGDGIVIEEPNGARMIKGQLPVRMP